MVHLYNPRATRLVFRIAQHAPDHLGYVLLDTDQKMYATDGYVCLISDTAHDSTEELYIKPGFSKKLNDSGQSYYLDEYILREESTRSEYEYDISYEEPEVYPRVWTRVPGRLASPPTEIPPHDSIRGGWIAKEYGLKYGIWLSGPWHDTVHLHGTDETDLVILASITWGDTRT